MRSSYFLASAAVASLSVGGCLGEDPTPAIVEASACTVLSTIHSTSSASITGTSTTGGLSDYSFSGSVSSETTITPVSASPCSNAMAQQLQGLCAYCQEAGDEPCLEATRSLFSPQGTSRMPPECRACGDNFCTAGESANPDDPGYCATDCLANCGDGVCNGNEAPTCPAGATDCTACAVDCSEACGDGICDNGEAYVAIPDRGLIACPQDCADPCGDGICTNGENADLRTGDNPLGCPQDCSSCGDDFCAGFENAVRCPGDCAECGDGVCSQGVETTAVCDVDCASCGDGVCTCRAGSSICEDASSCPRDCEPVCGDDICSGDETATCAADCGTCGNGSCESGEDAGNCLADCGECGDGFCRGEETPQSCSADCPECGDGACDDADGETAISCADDCTQCGDGECTDGENVESCASDCPGCGDGVCDGATESATSCAADCG